MRQTNPEVQEAIRLELTRRRRTQTDLAAALNLSQRAISRRLCGEMPFTVEELLGTARFLEVDPSELLPRTETAAAL